MPCSCQKHTPCSYAQQRINHTTQTSAPTHNNVSTTQHKRVQAILDATSEAPCLTSQDPRGRKSAAITSATSQLPSAPGAASGAPDAIPTASRQLQSADAGVNSASCTVLASVLDPLFEACLALLEDEEPRVRVAVGEVLGGLARVEGPLVWTRAQLAVLASIRDNYVRVGQRTPLFWVPLFVCMCVHVCTWMRACAWSSQLVCSGL